MATDMGIQILWLSSVFRCYLIIGYHTLFFITFFFLVEMLTFVFPVQGGHCTQLMKLQLLPGLLTAC